jgi:hypothetical protein
MKKENFLLFLICLKMINKLNALLLQNHFTLVRVVSVFIKAMLSLILASVLVGSAFGAPQFLGRPGGFGRPGFGGGFGRPGFGGGGFGRPGKLI